MNTDRFIAEQNRWFNGSYQQFEAFGGPPLYFHRECLRAGEAAFLSERHVELIYATLTAWGMHRMGAPDTTKTRLTEWDRFSSSLTERADSLQRFRGHRMLDMTPDDYSKAICDLQPDYEALKLSIADATIVANSKALYHLLPDLVPPIDRQHIIRFFRQRPDQWRNGKGKFTAVTLPPGIDAQFKLFHTTCVEIKRLLDRVSRSFIEEQSGQYAASAPKAIDNAIVNYVRIVSTEATNRA